MVRLWLAVSIALSAAAQTVPFVVTRPKPEYSAEARLAKLEGSVVVSLQVGADGQPGDAQVVRPLGLGLDEKAIDNVHTWQFRPAANDGIPVPAQIKVEVFFRSQRALWDWHLIRAVFQPPAQATRPVLIKAEFPATVEQEENASVTIAFDIGPKGAPLDPHVVKSSDARWEGQLLKAVRAGWRFRPGAIDGKPVTVPAWFEFVRGSHSPIPPAHIPDR